MSRLRRILRLSSLIDPPQTEALLCRGVRKMSSQHHAQMQINESKSHGKAAALTALHKLYGMDRYGGHRYLVKLTDHELDSLESDLHARLKELQIARLIKGERAKERLDNDLLQTLGAKADINQSLKAALRSQRMNAALSSLLIEEAEGLWSFPLFDPSFAQKLADTAKRFIADKRAAAAAAASSYGVSYDDIHHAVLDAMGLGAFADELLADVVAPLGKVLYAGSGSGFAGLDWRYAYVISYGPQSGGSSSKAAADGQESMTPAADASLRTGLRSHTDDSELTLNVCLQAAEEGGEVIFRGLRASAKEGSEEARITLRPGQALLHAGQHLHAVQPTTAGERHHLIVWARDSAYRSRTCPCCVNQRRPVCGIHDTWR